MKTASVRDLRYSFKKVESLLRQGEGTPIMNPLQRSGRMVQPGR